MASLVESARALLAVVPLLVAGCATPRARAQALGVGDRAASKAEVLAAFEGLVEAARQLDFEAYLACFDAPRFTGWNADGTVTHTMEAFAETARAGFESLQRYERLDFDRVRVTLVGDGTAVLVNEFHAVVVLTGGELVPVSGAGLQVWSKASGAWRLVSVASSDRSMP